MLNAPERVLNADDAIETAEKRKGRLIAERFGQEFSASVGLFHECRGLRLPAFSVRRLRRLRTRSTRASVVGGAGENRTHE